jgi:hypothetical protein
MVGIGALVELQEWGRCICIFRHIAEHVWCFNWGSHQPRYKIMKGCPRFVWKGIDKSSNYFTRSSWGRWVGRTNGENDAFRKTTLEIGTCSYHGWSWDIGLVGRLHWHLFHFTFFYSIESPHYQPPFNAMLWLWLVSMIFECGFKHVSSGLFYSDRLCLWLWRI